MASVGAPHNPSEEGNSATRKEKGPAAGMDFWVTVGALAVPLSFWRRWGRSRSDEEADAADPPTPAQLAMPHISGQEIKLGQLIGKGGMGSVHEAMWGGARVAVKV